MINNHLTYFKIENFKKFDSLEVKDIGQFNLIVGDNNVGKTCLLEALSIGNTPKEIISSLYHILMSRKDSDYYNRINLLGTPYYAKGELHPILEEVDNHQTNILTTVLKNENKPLIYNNGKKVVRIENLLYQYEEDVADDKRIIKQFIEDNELFNYPEIHKKTKNWLVFFENEQIRFLADVTSKYYIDFFFKKPFSNLIYISSKINSENVLRYQMTIEDFDVKQDIIKTLNDLFQLSILDFEFRKNEFSISTKENKIFHSIKRYGEGIQRIVLFYLEILCNESGVLFIDEIEIGLYYSKMTNIWISIFTLAGKYNVQLFATTHSKECIEAYVDAAEKIQKINANIRLIKLATNAEKHLKAITYPFNEFEYLVESETETR